MTLRFDELPPELKTRIARESGALPPPAPVAEPPPTAGWLQRLQEPWPRLHAGVPTILLWACIITGLTLLMAATAVYYWVLVFVEVVLWLVMLVRHLLGRK